MFGKAVSLLLLLPLFLSWNLTPSAGTVRPTGPEIYQYPTTNRWHAKRKAQSEHVHVAHTGFFFLHFGTDLHALVRRLVAKSLRRSSVGSLPRVVLLVGWVSRIQVQSKPDCTCTKAKFGHTQMQVYGKVRHVCG